MTASYREQIMDACLKTLMHKSLSTLILWTLVFKEKKVVLNIKPRRTSPKKLPQFFMQNKTAKAYLILIFSLETDHQCMAVDLMVL